MKQMNGGKQSERGQELDEGSGHGRQKGQATKSLLNSTAGRHSLLNKTAAGNAASGFSARHRPHNQRPQMTGLAANNNSCR